MPHSNSLSVVHSQSSTQAHARRDTEPVGSNSNEANRDSPLASQEASAAGGSEELEDE
jgi:hypothetical protein